MLTSHLDLPQGTVDLLCLSTHHQGGNSYCQVDPSDGFWDRCSDRSKGLKVRFREKRRKCEWREGAQVVYLF